MLFSAEQVFQSAAVEARELEARPVEPQVLTQVFNDRLRELVIDVCGVDEERLLAEYEVPNAVVQGDPSDVDLTDDGTGAGAREWVQISYIDAVDADGEGDEVVLGTAEQRNQLESTYGEEWTLAYVHSGYTKLRKVGDWTGVDHLLVYGVLMPIEISVQEYAAQVHNYPAAMRQALVWELVTGLAPFVGIAANDPRLVMWEAKRKLARDRLELNTVMFLPGRIEPIARVSTNR